MRIPPSLSSQASITSIVSGCSGLTDVGLCCPVSPCLTSLRSLDVSNIGRIGLPSFTALSTHCRSADVSQRVLMSVSELMRIIRQVDILPPILPLSLSVSSNWSLSSAALHCICQLIAPTSLPLT